MNFESKGNPSWPIFLYYISELHKINFRILLLTCVNRDHLWIFRKYWTLALFSSKWHINSFSTYSEQVLNYLTIES